MEKCWLCRRSIPEEIPAVKIELAAAEQSWAGKLAKVNGEEISDYLDARREARLCGVCRRIIIKLVD